MKNTHRFIRIKFILIFILITSSVVAQKKKIAMKDSIDAAFDMSDYLIEAHGFIPVPFIITEPALGGFRVALEPIFLKKNPPYIDSLHGKIKITPVAPDITGGIGLYTVNNTWMAAAFRKGTLVKSRIKYTVGTGYANINMNYYRTVARLGEKKFQFNLKTLPIYLEG